MESVMIVVSNTKTNTPYVRKLSFEEKNDGRIYIPIWWITLKITVNKWSDSDSIEADRYLVRNSIKS